MAIRSCLALAAALTLAACAGAPKPPPLAEETAPETGTLEVGSLQRAVSDALEAGAAAPRDLAVSIVGVEALRGQLVFEARFELPQTWSRRAQEYTAYISCEPGRLDACVKRVIDAAGALNRP